MLAQVISLETIVYNKTILVNIYTILLITQPISFTFTLVAAFAIQIAQRDLGPWPPALAL